MLCGIWSFSMSFKIFSTKVTVSFLFMAVLSLMLFSDKTGYALLMICSAVIHEAGHFVAMLLCKCTPTEVKLIPGSVQICAPTVRLKHETFILVSGPLFNFFAFAVLFLLSDFYDSIKLLEFSLINLLYFAFNILPLCGLDGGSILFNLLLKNKGQKTAEKTLNLLTYLAAAATLFTFLLSVFRSDVNYSVCILFCYLILSIFLKF